MASTQHIVTPRDASSGAGGRCPNCDAPGLRPFFAVSGIPAHSVRLMHSRQEALDYPKGNLELGFCASCGFVTNLLFDVSLNEYSDNFEESQHFSARFDGWARALVDRLVRDYDIHGKRVLEIGCGKGEFLALLCEAGQNYGIGIDPGCIAGRLPNEGAGPGQVQLIQDLYSERYAELPAEVVMCRHTLEHIQPTREFMQMVRRVIGPRTDTLVFLEVPDATRVWRERAFWDVYYEHCTYLTAGSLARVFRATGFEIVELVRDFGDQYLWITARPVDGPTRPSLPIEDDLEATAADVAAFERECPVDIAHWKERLRAMAAGGRKPVLWGAGSKAVGFITTAGLEQEVDYLVDINPFKAGKFLPGTGHAVMAPDYLQQRPPDVVVAMNGLYADEIRARLAALRVPAKVVPLDR